MHPPFNPRFVSALALAAELFCFGTPARADDSSDAATAKVESAESTIRLHVKSPDGAVAVERVDTGELVCTSPCDREVPATARYRIGGPRPSETFILDSRSGAAKISVDRATSKGFWTGALTLGAAGALVGSGALALALGYASHAPAPGSDGSISDTSYSDTMMAGTVLLVVGMAAGIWGGATLASNLQSRVTGNVLKDPPARGTAQPLRTARTGPAWSAGPTLYVPLFGGTF